MLLQPVSCFLFWRPLFTFHLLFFYFIFLGKIAIDDKLGSAYDSGVLLLQPWQIVRSHRFFLDFDSLFDYLLFLLHEHVSQELLHNLRIFLRLAIPHEILKCVLKRNYQFWETNVFHNLLNENCECLESVTKDLFFGGMTEEVGAAVRDFFAGPRRLISDWAVPNLGEIGLVWHGERRDNECTHRDENLSVSTQEVQEIIQMQMEEVVLQMACDLDGVQD